MANNWKGYFLKATKTGKVLPLTYIAEDSWDSTPNQREELKAYRDENTRDLTRVTAAGRKTAIQFRTRGNLHLDEKIAFQKFFTDAETDAAQRRVTLEFWNDEENAYKTGDFYRPNMHFVIKRVSATDIIYDELTIDLVEY